jgi:hypothetical protein
MYVSIQMPSSLPTLAGHSGLATLGHSNAKRYYPYTTHFFLYPHHGVSLSTCHCCGHSETKIDNSLLLDLETWIATLHVVGVEGKGTDSVDIFELTQTKYRAGSQAHIRQSPSPIIFDRNNYPPTKKGLKTLKLELITQACLSEGTNLTCNNQKYQLDCFCYKYYHQKKGKKATNLQAHHISDSVSDHSDDATSDVDDDMDSIIDSYDTFGVNFGIDRYQYLPDRYAQRPA